MTQPTPLEYWESLTDKKNYIRNYGECLGVPSRDWELTHLLPGESLLDVGCGPGCSYENLLAPRAGLAAGRTDVRYRGLDFSPGFVDACRELFPGADFRVGDAMALPEPDNAWDVVLLRHVVESTPGYQVPIQEALRVARRKVLIVKWRPLFNEPDAISANGAKANDYNARDFWIFLESFVLPLEYKEFPNPRPNWGWCLYKAMDECIFDLDDLWDDSPNQDLLFDLKARYPQLKVTLFATPGRVSVETLARYRGLDWVELAAHGGRHEPNDECTRWTRQDAAGWLEAAEQLGCVHGFRPPGWLMNEATLDELAARGYWLASVSKDRERAAARGLRAWYADWDFRSVHGHFQSIHQPLPRLRNGLQQLVEERGLPWDERTAFKFVSEVVK